jgi:uncharacterized alpha/beta hydrolase family protein
MKVPGPIRQSEKSEIGIKKLAGSASPQSVRRSLGTYQKNTTNPLFKVGFKDNKILTPPLSVTGRKNAWFKNSGVE